MSAIIRENRTTCTIITFNRPEIRSPLSRFVLEELLAVLSEIAASDNQQVVFTGRDGVFAAGADLREIAALNSQTAPEFARLGQTVMNRIAALDATAAIDGFCFGGALDLALACRRRIASPRAVFAHPGADLGIMTGWGGTQRLPRLIGAAAAFEMFFLARRVDAREANRLGLVDLIDESPLDAAQRTYEK